MKSQLISSDFRGLHNSDIDGTRGRLLKGASWKKQRTIAMMPADESIPAKVAFAMWNVAFPPNNLNFRILAQGLEVGDAYTNAFGAVLAHPDLSKWEYILTIEHDNLPPYDGLLKLIERMDSNPKFDCISGLYFTKGEGGVAQIWGDVSDPIPNYRPQLPVPGQLVECYGVGMGFALWRIKMFKDEKLRKPWFRTLPNNTQDLYFWSDAWKCGHRCAVDCNVLVGHYDVETDIVW